MKKMFFGLLLIFLATLAWLYYFIPGSLKVSDVIVVNCTINGTNRFLLSVDAWNKWWPADGVATTAAGGNTRFTYKGASYQVTRSLYNEVEVLIERGGRRIKSVINDFPLSRDSVAIQWQYTVKTSYNPVTRWRQYQEARTVKAGMEEVLVQLQSFLAKRANVYGIDIHEIFSRDTILVTTKKLSQRYPGVPEIYGLIGNLKKHIAAEHGIQTNYPMLNVRKTDTGEFETMVAIPVNKPLQENGVIFNKRFVPWKTLVAEVKGGVFTVDQAYKKMTLFVEDYQRTSMAIPFELLITDRSIESDTLKWVSVICQPVS